MLFDRTLSMASMTLLACSALGAPLAAQNTGRARLEPIAAAKPVSSPTSSFAPMLARVIPAVVTIRVTTETKASVEIKPDGNPVAEPSPRFSPYATVQCET